MKTQTAKNVARTALNPLEELNTQVARPILEEAIRELGGFVGSSRFGAKPREIAKEDLKRAREAEHIKEQSGMDNKDSNESAAKIQAVLKTYDKHESKVTNEQNKLKGEFVELQSEVAKLAKAAGIETKAHMENVPNKVGTIDIKHLTSIVRILRLKTEESKSASELVSQRQNAKQATGMLAWVSGKQMKIHEQGTMQLQG